LLGRFEVPGVHLADGLVDLRGVPLKGRAGIPAAAARGERRPPADHARAEETEGRKPKPARARLLLRPLRLLLALRLRGGHASPPTRGAPWPRALRRPAAPGGRRPARGHRRGTPR